MDPWIHLCHTNFDKVHALLRIMHAIGIQLHVLSRRRLYFKICDVVYEKSIFFENIDLVFHTCWKFQNTFIKYIQLKSCSEYALAGDTNQCWKKVRSAENQIDACFLWTVVHSSTVHCISYNGLAPVILQDLLLLYFYLASAGSFKTLRS